MVDIRERRLCRGNRDRTELFFLSLICLSWFPGRITWEARNCLHKQHIWSLGRQDGFLTLTLQNLMVQLQNCWVSSTGSWDILRVGCQEKKRERDEVREIKLIFVNYKALLDTFSFQPVNFRFSSVRGEYRYSPDF